MVAVSVLVSVSQDYLDHMPDVVQKLASAGMTDIQSLETVGVITGSLDDSKIAEISSIEGVVQIERSQETQIPPPDADIQ